MTVAPFIQHFRDLLRTRHQSEPWSHDLPKLSKAVSDLVWITTASNLTFTNTNLPSSSRLLEALQKAEKLDIAALEDLHNHAIIFGGPPPSYGATSEMRRVVAVVKAFREKIVTDGEGLFACRHVAVEKWGVDDNRKVMNAFEGLRADCGGA